MSQSELISKLIGLLAEQDILSGQLQENQQQVRETVEQLSACSTCNAATPAEEPSARLTFLVSDLDGVDREVIVEGHILKLGSDEHAHVRVNDPQAARMMAVIEIAKSVPDPILTLIDLGNEPCTRLNDVKITKVNLNAEDVISIGYGAKINLIKVEATQPQLSCSRATLPAHSHQEWPASFTILTLFHPSL